MEDRVTNDNTFFQSTLFRFRQLCKMISYMFCLKQLKTVILSLTFEGALSSAGESASE